MSKRRKAWSKVIEAHGQRVRIFEFAPGAMLYREVRDASGQRDRRTLGHRDRALAETQARALCQRLAELRLAGVTATLTVGQLLGLYRLHRVPLLKPMRAAAVRAMLDLLEEGLGRALPVEDLGQHHVDAYTQQRTSGALRTPRAIAYNRTTVRAGTIGNELATLRTVLRWARLFRLNGRRLLTTNPLEGLGLPSERNVRRPLATDERYQQLLAVADRADRRGRFRCVLVLARETGRRITAIISLRAHDVLVTRDQVERALSAIGQPVAAAAHWPHGAVRWAAAHDKAGVEVVAPLSRAARLALDRYLRTNPRLGDAPLFPGIEDVTQPIRKHVAAHWLHRAETLAGLPRLEGGAYHPFRRLWASERRHLPAQDVAAAGGWKSLQVMRTAYQHADAATMYSVTDLRAGDPTLDQPAQEGEARQEVK